MFIHFSSCIWFSPDNGIESAETLRNHKFNNNNNNNNNNRNLLQVYSVGPLLLVAQCGLHKSFPLVLILRQTSSVHTRLYNFFKIHFNIILPSTPVFPKLSLLFRIFGEKDLNIPLVPHVCYMFVAIQFHEVDRCNNIWRRVHIIKFAASAC